MLSTRKKIGFTGRNGYKPNKMLSYRYQNGFHQQELMKKGENDLFQIKKWFPLVRKQNDFHYVERWFPLVGLDEKQKNTPRQKNGFNKHDR